VNEAVIESLCKPLGLDKTEGVLRLLIIKHSIIKKYFKKPKQPIFFRIIHSAVYDLTDEGKRNA